jgi:hypothetical protein
MASANYNAKEALGQNDLLSLEKSTARQTIIPTLASFSAECPVSGYLSRLVRRKCAWNDPSIFW